MTFHAGRQKTGGRRAGIPNKSTASIKQALVDAFEQTGGVASLTAWAKKNPGEFYTKIWIRILPYEVNDAAGEPLVPEKPFSLFESARTFAFIMNQAKHGYPAPAADMPLPGDADCRHP